MRYIIGAMLIAGMVTAGAAYAGFVKPSDRIRDKEEAVATEKQAAKSTQEMKEVLQKVSDQQAQIISILQEQKTLQSETLETMKALLAKQPQTAQ